MSAVVAAATLAKSGEAAKAGPIGLAVILLLCIACYFLFKSMSKHMREVRENFPVDAPAEPRVVKSDLGTSDLTRPQVVAPPEVEHPAQPAIEAPGTRRVPPDQPAE